MSHFIWWLIVVFVLSVLQAILLGLFGVKIVAPSVLGEFVGRGLFIGLGWLMAVLWYGV